MYWAISHHAWFWCRHIYYYRIWIFYNDEINNKHVIYNSTLVLTINRKVMKPLRNAQGKYIYCAYPQSGSALLYGEKSGLSKILTTKKNAFFQILRLKTNLSQKLVYWVLRDPRKTLGQPLSSMVNIVV